MRQGGRGFTSKQRDEHGWVEAFGQNGMIDVRWIQHDGRLILRFIAGGSLDAEYLVLPHELADRFLCSLGKRRLPGSGVMTEMQCDSVSNARWRRYARSGEFPLGNGPVVFVGHRLVVPGR